VVYDLQQIFRSSKQHFGAAIAAWLVSTVLTLRKGIKMKSLLFLILTILAIGTAVWYGVFYQSPTPGATYASTYLYLSIGAAIIFLGLLTSGFFNRRQSNSRTLSE